MKKRTIGSVILGVSAVTGGIIFGPKVIPTAMASTDNTRGNIVGIEQINPKMETLITSGKISKVQQAKVIEIEQQIVNAKANNLQLEGEMLYKELEEYLAAEEIEWVIPNFTFED